jgi:hypothetical protein
MATYRDPIRCFAPLELIERILEIRVESGHPANVFLFKNHDLAEYLDAYGFDVYLFDNSETQFKFGDYRGPLAPGGSRSHNSMTAH